MKNPPYIHFYSPIQSSFMTKKGIKQYSCKFLGPNSETKTTVQLLPDQSQYYLMLFPQDGYTP